ncbi:MAG: tRNA pseudouridine(13) synthase TruD [Legionella sp.]|nr:tRNA pseudouridine(13) synthase TruD [Legionella sp.]
MFSLNWPRAQSSPLSTALFKKNAEDFHVNEFFQGAFSGEGEHILLKIEKKGVTTEALIQALSLATGIPVKGISYAGLKDKQSLATQWISIHAPGKIIEGASTLNGWGWKVIDTTRHHKKLRPGFLAGNHFKIKLRDVSKPEDLIHRIEYIKEKGVPNYFGEQRFGLGEGNLIKAQAMLVQGQKVKNRFLKGIYLSSARAWIYNQILSRRVQEQTWNKALSGDVIQLGGSNSIFTIDTIDEEIIHRIKIKDISPASPLPGKNRLLGQGDAFKLINEIFEAWDAWIMGLQDQNIEESWRANILHVENLELTIQTNTADLSFTLPAGSYATVVLRELVDYIYQY